MRNVTFWFFASFLFFFGCQYSKHEGYSITKSGLHYRLNYIGDGDRNPEIGDYLHYNLVLSTIEDSIIYTNTNSASGGVKLIKFNNSTKGSIQEALSMMHQGDSVSLYIETENLFLEPFSFVKYIPKDLETIKAELRLTKLYSPKELEDLEKKNKRRKDKNETYLYGISGYFIEF